MAKKRENPELTSALCEKKKKSLIQSSNKPGSGTRKFSPWLPGVREKCAQGGKPPLPLASDRRKHFRRSLCFIVVSRRIDNALMFLEWKNLQIQQGSWLTTTHFLFVNGFVVLFPLLSTSPPESVITLSRSLSGKRRAEHWLLLNEKRSREIEKNNVTVLSLCISLIFWLSICVLHFKQRKRTSVNLGLFFSLNVSFKCFTWLENKSYYNNFKVYFPTWNQRALMLDWEILQNFYCYLIVKGGLSLMVINKPHIKFPLEASRQVL